ncbi:MAG: hypothetical protein VX223_09895 [Myxococcota bacterium]|nr:hypothetical protein [Myxococcota bacterium]
MQKQRIAHSTETAKKALVFLCSTLIILPGCLVTEDDADAQSAPQTDTATAPEPPPSDTATAPDADMDIRLDGTSETLIQDEIIVGDAGSYSLLDGEIILEFTDDTLRDQRITVERSLVDFRGQVVIGYIWGPHGLPIDPPANLTVTLSTSELTSEKPDTFRLLYLTDDGPKPLVQTDPTLTEDIITFRAQLTTLIDTVVAVP